jgi:hypothetical protein
VIECKFENAVGAKAVGFSHGDFYEKVVKVKADVAALLNSFLRAITFAACRPAGGCTSAEANPGDRARGVSAERIETPLAGGAAASMCASAFCWRAACQRRGGNHPRPGFPLGGNGKGGSDSLLPQAFSRRSFRMVPSAFFEFI